MGSWAHACKRSSAVLILGSGGLRHIKRDLKIMALVAPWVICMSLIWTTLASSPATSGLDAYDLVSRLSAAAKVPEGWPRINLDARSAQLILDLEIVRVQAWNAYLQQGRCEPRQSHLRGSQYPKQPRPFTGFVPMPLVLGSLVCILACGWAVHFARGFRTHFRSGRQSLDIPLAEKHPCGSSPCSYGAVLSETQKETAQLESNHEELQTEADDDEMPNSSQAVERGIIDGMMLDSLNDFQLIKEPQRFMTQWSWTEQCGKAFLGIVHEGEVLASGFGGKVRHAQWDGRMVVTKEILPRGGIAERAVSGASRWSMPILGLWHERCWRSAFGVSVPTLHLTRYACARRGPCWSAATRSRHAPGNIVLIAAGFHPLRFEARQLPCQSRRLDLHHRFRNGYKGWRRCANDLPNLQTSRRLRLLCLGCVLTRKSVLGGLLLQS